MEGPGGARLRDKLPATTFAVLLGSAAFLLTTADTDRAAAQSGCPAQPPAGVGGQIFRSNGGALQLFTVPQQVTTLRVTVEGGHGGETPTAGLGGPGGGVDAFIAVTPGECLGIQAGQYGGTGDGGNGYADGGAKASLDGTEPGYSSAAGGGASAILRGSLPLIVAGGGGGGGGGGAGGTCDPQCHPFKDAGGNGGAAGSPPEAGADGDYGGNPAGGKGGAGGGADGNDGGDGQQFGCETNSGVGGGGGGGVSGGEGGFPGGDCDSETPAKGGGGGGGGKSIAPGVLTNPRPTFYAVTSCVGRGDQPTTLCDGDVVVYWQSNTPSDPLGPLSKPGASPLPSLAVPLGTGAFSVLPVVHALALDLTQVTKHGVQAVVMPPLIEPTSGPKSVRLLLKLYHRRKGKYRLVNTRVEIATEQSPHRISIKVPRKVRKKLRTRDTGKMKLDVFDADTGQRLDSQRLRLD